MADDPSRTAGHLTLVQSVVTRMAGNSAMMKAWTVALVTAVFVFAGLAEDPHWLVALGGCVPAVAFWAMDARYLQLERCYIALYAAAVAGTVRPFDLDYRPHAAAAGSVWHAARSWSVSIFYGALLALMLGLLAFLGFRDGA